MVPNPARFAAAAGEARRQGKRIVVLKSGASESGQALVAAHTGALAGEDRLYEAFLRDCSVVRGAALLLTNGEPVTVNTSKGGREDVINQFYFLGQGRIFNRIPMLLIFFILIALAAWFLLSKTTFGFRVYAVGGSEKSKLRIGDDIDPGSGRPLRVVQDSDVFASIPV